MSYRKKTRAKKKVQDLGNKEKNLLGKALFFPFISLNGENFSSPFFN